MSGKVIFITGTSSGLGEALASMFHEKGNRVYGSCRNPKSGRVPFVELKVDVRDAETVTAAISHILSMEGRIDVVIANAGLGILGPLEYLKAEDINQVWQTNVAGLIHLLQASLSPMRGQQSGKFIAISSIAAEVALPFRGIYCASKAAVDRIILALRHEVAGSGVSCCTVQAGDIATSLNEHRITTGTLDDSFYHDNLENTRRKVHHGVEKGIPASVAAQEIGKLIALKKMPPTWVVGKPVQQWSLLAKRVLPERLFERLIAAYSR